jgi:hypothetical protein
MPPSSPVATTSLVRSSDVRPKLFGRCHTLAVRADWGALADALQRLTGLEDEFRARLLG